MFTQPKVLQNYYYEDIHCPDLKTLQLINENEMVRDE